jgi:hypothetical protein
MREDHWMDVVLNDKQIEVLHWIGDRCPVGVYDDDDI